MIPTITVSCGARSWTPRARSQAKWALTGSLCAKWRGAQECHAAPYHHFVDKAAFIRTLAQQAFARLTVRLRDAAQSRGSPAERLESVGVAYVLFALENSAEFRFMFRPELCKPAGYEGDELERASLDAYQVLVDALTECEKAGLLRAHRS